MGGVGWAAGSGPSSCLRPVKMHPACQKYGEDMGQPEVPVRLPDGSAGRGLLPSGPAEDVVKCTARALCSALSLRLGHVARRGQRPVAAARRLEAASFARRSFHEDGEGAPKTGAGRVLPRPAPLQRGAFIWTQRPSHGLGPAIRPLQLVAGFEQALQAGKQVRPAVRPRMAPTTAAARGSSAATSNAMHSVRHGNCYSAVAYAGTVGAGRSTAPPARQSSLYPSGNRLTFLPVIWCRAMAAFTTTR